MTTIDPRDLQLAPVRQLLDDWMVLTAGTIASGTPAAASDVPTSEATDGRSLTTRSRSFNSMTVAWGFIGAMWRRPVVITPVRTTRFTYEYMERYDTWTLTAFPERFRSALQLLGSRSGRDRDKIAESGLTPIPAERIEAPTYAEAILSIECKTLYYNDISPERMRDTSLDALYDNDYHRMYYGEILAVRIAE
jgi:flavin reductase (DIM6/NTAB) family NADH-FMN oxidoreductase RutF